MMRPKRPKRPILARLQDRLWSIHTNRLTLDTPANHDTSSAHGSISGLMAWPTVCAAFADGRIDSRNFRRLRAVMEVVETLGPCEGRHHAEAISKAHESQWLDHPMIRKIAQWGDPIQWPAVLLRTPHSYAPTSLRYLSHALWLKSQGFLQNGSQVVEIGVGYGGLAAMNAVVTDARTLLVDLPNVERAAFRMLSEIGLGHMVELSSAGTQLNMPDCVISNYAFSELSIEQQDLLLGRYFARSRHGMLLSNANIFSAQIGGRTNEQLMTELKALGLNATCHNRHRLLSQSDERFGNVLITW
jgi:hypothetical protein